MDEEISLLSKALVGEIFLALGFSKYGWGYRFFHRPFIKIANRLSSITLTADHMIETHGFPAAAEWTLRHWCNNVDSFNDGKIPQQGPLLIISNHAGTYDTFILASRVKRNDLHLISSDVPFLKSLPNASKHIFFLSDNTQERMLAARQGIQHLQNGGSLLLYGTGLIDPDPAVYPDADKWIERWLSSIDLFVRKVPESQILLSIVSGVVSEKWAYHPITLLMKVDWKKRRLAEFGQIIYQLSKPGKLYVSPSVSFSDPFYAEEVMGSSNDRHVLPAVISRGKSLLAEHCKRYGKCAILNKN